MKDTFEILKQEFINHFQDNSFNFKSDDKTWIYAAPKCITDNDSIHYRLIKDDEFFFVELHIDGNGYQDFIKRIRECFEKDENLRNYRFSTYYSSKHWRKRTPVLSKEDLQEDLSALQDIVQNVLIPNPIEKKSSASEVQIYNHVTVDKLLSCKLQIPQYQRPYCWEEKNIRDFFVDLDAHHYHIGSIILKCQNNQRFDIIDGQQRLTTLAIYQWIQNKKVARSSLLNSEKSFSSRERWNLHQAVKILENSDFNIDLSKIELSVVVLAEELPEDLAYTFFSNSNSTGKKLSDYDLLKTHHLRYISSDKEAEYYSSNWHALEKSGAMDDVLHKMLYRLRKWDNKETFVLNASNRESRDVFQHYKSVDLLRNFPSFCHQMPRFNSLLTGGTEFFNFCKRL